MRSHKRFQQPNRLQHLRQKVQAEPQEPDWCNCGPESQDPRTESESDVYGAPTETYDDDGGVRIEMARYVCNNCGKPIRRQRITPVW